VSSLTWKHVLLGLALWSCESVGALSAQSVFQNDRVRVQSTETYASEGTTRTSVFTTTGTLSGWANDTLRIDTDSQSRVSIAASDIRKLEVSDGRKSNAGKGMVTGTVIGAFVGFSLVLSAAAAFGDLSDAFSSDGLKYVAAGAGVGFVIGTAIGALGSDDAWREVTVGDLRVTVAPNGLTLSVPVQGR